MWLQPQPLLHVRNNCRVPVAFLLACSQCCMSALWRQLISGSTPTRLDLIVQYLDIASLERLAPRNDGDRIGIGSDGFAHLVPPGVQMCHQAASSCIRQPAKLMTALSPLIPYHQPPNPSRPLLKTGSWKTEYSALIYMYGATMEAASLPGSRNWKALQQALDDAFQSCSARVFPIVSPPRPRWLSTIASHHHFRRSMAPSLVLRTDPAPPVFSAVN